MTVLANNRAKEFPLGTWLLFGVCAMFAFGNQVASADDLSIPSLMVQPSMNLVLSVNDVEKSKEFYGEILALKPMRPLQLPGNFEMTRFQVGTTEIKFLTSNTTQKRQTGSIDEAIGIRLLTLFLVDREGLVDRMDRHGYPTPEFSSRSGRSETSAIVTDPDGNRIELVIVPEASSAEAQRKIEIGLTVADVEKSRAFYGGFLGLQVLEPIADAPSSGRTTYRFRHGDTMIKFWSFGSDLPTHSGRWQQAHGIRYIQYIVRDIDAVSDYAKSAGATIDQEIFALGKLARIMFIADPDGIINEFVGGPKR